MREEKGHIDPHFDSLLSLVYPMFTVTVKQVAMQAGKDCQCTPHVTSKINIHNYEEVLGIIFGHEPLYSIPL